VSAASREHAIHAVCLYSSHLLQQHLITTEYAASSVSVQEFPAGLQLHGAIPVSRHQEQQPCSTLHARHGMYSLLCFCAPPAAHFVYARVQGKVAQHMPRTFRNPEPPVSVPL
jgi:hypothetical protein